MLKRLGLLAIGAAVMTAGCLQKDTTHTLYISPDHEVTWVATEGDVRSDAEDALERFGEEGDYLSAAAEGRHPVARALTSLAPDAVVRTQLLRDQRPFRVQTDARVGPIDRVMLRLFDASGVPTAVRFTSDASSVTLAVRFDFGVPISETNHPASVLLQDLASFKLVLTEGRFIAAEGWDISGDVALVSREWLERVEDAQGAGHPLDLTLSWEAR
jgi:hypothetical protein